MYSLDSSMYYNLCDKYLDIIDVINNVDFNNDYLNSLKNNIITKKDLIIKLKKIFIKISSRKNIIAKILLNILLPYDYIISLIFNKHIVDIDNVEIVFDSISELEMLLSFSNIIKDTNTYTLASSSDEINVVNMVHPLIKNCVSNDYSQRGGVILTGSNMSGKTTFMRTLGVNQILFNACKIACADYYFAPNLQVFTSLRAQDELSEGVSTFYAEILRMKLINEKIQDNKCLILVDEIFKGTNANDRIDASLKVIEKLNKYNQFFIISTHDFKLCNAINITNYHFNEEYNNDLISFDYKIKIGKCNSKNAMYLLKMAKIIE